MLLLRIKKLCNLQRELKFADITLNPFTHEVWKENHALDLTKKEYELLKYFLPNQRMIFSREQILNHVWGRDYFGDARTADTHIRRLRKKIGEAYIQTWIGTGYSMGGRNAAREVKLPWTSM